MIGNQKGGIGKTALTTGLASAIAEAGGRVLIGDLDPQGNATAGVAVSIGERDPSAYDLMSSTTKGIAANCILSIAWDGVDIIGSDIRLASIESDGAPELTWRLDIAFEDVDLSMYDAVLLDSPPSLGALMFSALTAADSVIAVTEPTIDSVMGVTKLEETVRILKLRQNQRLVFDKVVISRRRNTGEHIFREKELREAYGDLIAKTVIPELAARQDAHSSRTPIHQFRGGNALALQLAYSDLLAELPIDLSSKIARGVAR
ncbi:chromosome partitioning protein ParA [Prescottella equi]|nr:chromosome partitioning protein ParA [Prescottella equi]